MCECQHKSYCVGCGKFRVLIPQLFICRECSDDWLRLTPVRSRGQELMPEEEHADRAA